MKNITQKLAPLTIAMLALTACDKPATTVDPRPRVLVSNPPTAWLVKQIAGDKFIVQTLASSGGCGHEFQPTDKEMVEAGKAIFWFTCGLEFEDAEWAKGIKKRPLFFDLDKAHCWMSLNNIATMASQIQLNMQPSAPGIFLANQKDIETFDAFRKGILARHTHLTQLLLPLSGQAFLADHPAYTHFAADYDLKQIAIEEDHHEASDADLTQVIAQAKAAGVKVLFLSSEGHRSEAEAIAKAVGAQVILADPNTENTPELLEMMANALVKAHAK